jgi:hypothetical protein
MPVVAPMVATPRVLLAHVPPGVASVSVIVAPTHNADGPTMAAGKGLTVIVALPVIVLVQPVIAFVATTV